MAAGRLPDPNATKHCSVCGEDKPLTNENWPGGGDGHLRGPCKPCNNARRKGYRVAIGKDPSANYFQSDDADGRAKAASAKGLARQREIRNARKAALGEITGFLFEWALEHAADVAEGKIDAETSSELREWGKLVLEAVPGATVEINNQRLRALLERERKAAENDGSAAHAVPTAPAPPGNGDEPALFGPPPNDGAGVHPER